MYQYVLFDFDGTIADTKKGIVNAARYALEKFGIYDNDQALLRFIGPSLWSSFENLYGFDKENQKLAVEYYRQYYFSKGMYESGIYPGIADLLKELQRKPVNIGIASIKTQQNVEEMLAYYGVKHFFDVIVGSSCDGSYTDKKTMITDVLKKMGADRSERSVYIGDSITDYIGAKEAGMDFIAALYDRGTEEFQNAVISMPAYEVKDILNYLL